ncbi:response regulator [Alishewanella sp. BS5-314]|uniref:response regulator n=1 Tax=Alishewanella sp. BS5-314 TaxID=2755587 RepID=UPI0021BAB783|nr:response regulator [Alishewanella sp. BS5-314]MCT8124973.1 response regulator [Alishewanella sp. BS5-314]
MAKVLLVDDEPLLLDAYQRMLRQTAFDCQTLSDSTQVLDYLNQHQVQIVVVDQLMPGLQGSDLLLLLAKEHPAIKRVLISGNLNLVEPVAKAAAHSLLEKPCSKAVLLSTLQALIEQA